jgi:hypothetical protein
MPAASEGEGLDDVALTAVTSPLHKHRLHGRDYAATAWRRYCMQRSPCP